MQINGEGHKKVPALVIAWDEEAQGVELQFDPACFRTWPFVLALLDMARRKAEDIHRMALVQNAAVAQAQAAQEDAIRRALRK